MTLTSMAKDNGHETQGSHRGGNNESKRHHRGRTKGGPVAHDLHAKIGELGGP